MIIKDKSILALLTYFIHSPPRRKRIPKPARIHSPDPFLRAGNAVSVLRKSISPENSFRKTESTELVLEFRQFLLWRNPTSPATTIQNKKRENPRQIKTECVVARQGRSGTAEAEADCRTRQSGGAEAVP